MGGHTCQAGQALAERAWGVLREGRRMPEEPQCTEEGTIWNSEETGIPALENVLGATPPSGFGASTQVSHFHN